MRNYYNPYNGRRMPGNPAQDDAAPACGRRPGSMRFYPQPPANQPPPEPPQPPQHPQPPQEQPPCPPEAICEQNQCVEPAPALPLAPACSGNLRRITGNTGAPAQNDNHTLTVGQNGPALLKDTYFLEKMAHFDRERIPERVVHANGTGAFGCFKTTHSMEEYTTADLFSQEGRITPVFVRFSTVIGSRGSADTLRDPRGFAVKFYTEEGNLDIVGNHLPVFFIRDAIKFPDLIHSLKPAPDSGVRDPLRFWDFYTQTPEATHMITWVYSDLGTVKSFRMIDGFGVNTYVWKNAKGERFYVKYHFVSCQGVQTIDRREAERLAGSDPDVAKKDLYRTLASGKTADWEFCVQLLPVCKAEDLPFDPLDDTKTWPQDLFPLHRVGTMTLSRNFENQFAQVEQAAFCPANTVPGIELSEDKMLAGRGFAYADTQRHRIGPNFDQLPINAPRSEVCNFQQDGAMRLAYRKGAVNYSPSSCTLGQCMPVQPVESKAYTALYSQGAQVRESIDKQENFKQAGERFRGMTKQEQEHLVDNIAVELCLANDYITAKTLEYFKRACPEWEEMTRCRIEAYRQAKQ